MSTGDRVTEWKRNIWAPWRMEYIESLAGEDDGCFLCRCRDETDRERENLVVWRGPRSLAVLNRFPYTGGHSLVAPLGHVGTLGEVDDATVLEMMAMVRDLQDVLAHALRAEGFNVGINIGRCAGAGLPGHLHVHIVPRWGGDTNFMPVFGDVRIIPTSLEKLWSQLRRTGEDLELPKLPRPAESGGKS